MIIHLNIKNLLIILMPLKIMRRKGFSTNSWRLSLTTKWEELLRLHRIWIMWCKNPCGWFITHVGCPVDCTTVPLIKGIDVCSSGEQEPHHLTAATEKNKQIGNMSRDKGQPEHYCCPSVSVAAHIIIVYTWCFMLNSVNAPDLQKMFD